MGMFRIEIEATGGHGCERETGDGGEVRGCGRMGCPDCEARRLVDEYLRVVRPYEPKAILRHWPGQDSEVVDDLITHRRKGHF